MFVRFHLYGTNFRPAYRDSLQITTHMQRKLIPIHIIPLIYIPQVLHELLKPYRVGDEVSLCHWVFNVFIFLPICCKVFRSLCEGKNCIVYELLWKSRFGAQGKWLDPHAKQAKRTVLNQRWGSSTYALWAKHRYFKERPHCGKLAS